MHHNKSILHVSKDIRALSLKHYLLQLGISSVDNIKGTSQHQRRTKLCHHTIIKVFCIFQLCHYKSIPQIPSIPGTIKELSRNMHQNKGILHVSEDIRALSLKHYLLQLGISNLDNIKGTSQHLQRTKLCHHTIIKVCCICQLCHYKYIPQIPVRFSLYPDQPSNIGELPYNKNITC